MSAAGTSSGRSQKLVTFIRAEALAMGFDVCRIAGPDGSEEMEAGLSGFLAENYHGTMDWLQETRDRRVSPQALWPEVRSIILLGMNYGPDEDPRALLGRPDAGNISVYARNRDYHELIKGRLKEIAAKLASRTGQDVKVFVDTAPVMEKPLAAKAGLGWQGKHTNLVSREFGSWLFLGSIFTTAELPYDTAETDHCGSCRACLDACPTGAFPAPYQIDARRCISYLTIESKGVIPVEFRRAMGNRIYGCDDCLAACPWNKFASASREIKLKARSDLGAPALEALLALDDQGFRALFSGSPVKRIGRDRFIRNCLIAAGNSGNPVYFDRCMQLLEDPSPLVRGMAVWAIAALGGIDQLTSYRSLAAGETDAEVCREWNRVGIAP